MRNYEVRKFIVSMKNAPPSKAECVDGVERSLAAMRKLGDEKPVRMLREVAAEAASWAIAHAYLSGSVDEEALSEDPHSSFETMPSRYSQLIWLLSESNPSL